VKPTGGQSRARRHSPWSRDCPCSASWSRKSLFPAAGVPPCAFFHLSLVGSARRLPRYECSRLAPSSKELPHCAFLWGPSRPYSSSAPLCSGGRPPANDRLEKINLPLDAEADREQDSHRLRLRDDLRERPAPGEANRLTAGPGVEYRSRLLSLRPSLVAFTVQYAGN